jgi:hypothetical protein
MILFFVGALCGAVVTVFVCALYTFFFPHQTKAPQPKKFRYRRKKGAKERSETDRLLEMIWF